MSIRDQYNALYNEEQTKKQQEEQERELQYQLTREEKIKEIADAACEHIRKLFMKSTKLDGYTKHVCSLFRKRYVEEVHLLIKHRIVLKESENFEYLVGRASVYDDYREEKFCIFYRNILDVEHILVLVSSFLKENNMLICFDTRYSGERHSAKPGYIDIFLEPTVNNLINAISCHGYSLFLSLEASSSKTDAKRSD